METAHTRRSLQSRGSGCHTSTIPHCLESRVSPYLWACWFRWVVLCMLKPKYELSLAPLLIFSRFGYDTGQISGFLAMPDFLRRFGQRHDNGTYYFSNVRSGLIVGLLSIGTLIGALVASPIADFIGRRLSISFWCVVLSVGFIVQISAEYHWYQIMMGVSTFPGRSLNIKS